MSIVLVGGHERMQDEYKVIGNRLEHNIKVFTKMTARFNKSIGTPDAIVVLINTVSHSIVHTALKEAKKKKIPIMRCHTRSGNCLEETLKQLKTVVL